MFSGISFSDNENGKKYMHISLFYLRQDQRFLRRAGHTMDLIAKMMNG